MLQGGARTFQDCETFEREIVDHCSLSFFLVKQDMHPSLAM